MAASSLFFFFFSFLHDTGGSPFFSPPTHFWAVPHTQNIRRIQALNADVFACLLFFFFLFFDDRARDGSTGQELGLDAPSFFFFFLSLPACSPDGIKVRWTAAQYIKALPCAFPSFFFPFFGVQRGPPKD